MTATVHRDPPSLSLPQTQNTAPVLEFTCLYTHDLKRKQKRWQDGFLRYHTFNKRIMVYDVPRNFIGDTHWTAGEALQDGDEVMLDKDGVLVQVEESVGRTETDLTELRKSAKHGSSEHGSSSPAHVARTPTSRPAVSRPVTAQGGKAPMQLRHRSLNTLLGTPKGPIGKATLPATSPFELRGNNAENAGWADGRPPKRQRLGGSWKAQRTTSAFEDPKHNERRAVQKKSAQRRQQKPPAKEIVDLSRDEDEPHEFLPDFTSDMIQPPSSPPRRVGLAESPLLARSSSPAFQTQKLPNSMSRNSANSQHARGEDPQAESRVTTARNAETPPQMPKQGMRGGPGLQTSDEQMQNPKLQRQRSMHATAILDASDHKTGQALRMPASSSKKKTLLCQEQLSNKPKRTSSANIDIAANVSLDAVSDGEVEAAADDPQRKLRARLARINKKYVLQPQTRTNLAVTDRGTDVQSVSAGRQSHREDDADVENPRMQTSFRSSELESCQTDAILSLIHI